MCEFFSFVSDPDKPIPERFMCMDWTTRKKILAGTLNYESDSHTAIADFYGYKGDAEDSLNKYEYNPLIGKFTVDQINHKINDSSDAEKWVKAVDFKKIVAPLIIKPIINPFMIIPPEITPEVLMLLKQWPSVWPWVWASVGASVWDSVGASVGASVWDSVWVSVGASVRASVWPSVGASVWASVGPSIGASVWASVWDLVGPSVWDSVGASVWDSVNSYLSSFFDSKFKYDFSPAIKLWEMGIVPSFDGKTWRLHGGETAIILWEGKL